MRFHVHAGKLALLFVVAAAVVTLGLNSFAMLPTGAALPVAAASNDVTPLPTNTSTATVAPTATATSVPTSTAVPAATVALTTNITLFPSTAVGGTDLSFRVDGTGFGPLETVSLSYTVTLSNGSSSTQNTVASADSSGAFYSAYLPIPANAAAGTYQVTAAGESTAASASAVLTITSNATTTPAPTATTLPTSTITPIPSPIATDTPTSTPVPTETPQPTATLAPVATATAVPTPFVSIVKVAVMHKHNGKEVETKNLNTGEKAQFVAAYHTLNADGQKMSGTVRITHSGTEVTSHAMSNTRYAGHRAFKWTFTFTNKKQLGTLYAHFTVNAGTSASAHRDRRFTVHAAS